MNDKFCVDCRHHENGRCGRAPTASNEDLSRWLVTGVGQRPKATLFFCEVERSSSRSCGIEGKNWEPIEAKAPPGDLQGSDTVKEQA